MSEKESNHPHSLIEELDQLPLLWRSRQPIFEFINAHVHPEVPGLLEGAISLPDDNGRIRYAGGIREGAFGHSTGPEGRTALAMEATRRLSGCLSAPDKESVDWLYEFAVENAAIDYIDELTRELAQDTEIDKPSLVQFCDWLVSRAPDREPVKLAIALIGAFGSAGYVEVIEALGRHDEFTLYAAVAIRHLLPNPDRALWSLAKQVMGWGRIRIVERLEATSDPEIQNWLLRDGYKNGVMWQYSVYSCAVGGHLIEALSADRIDDDLLAAAGDILSTLVELGGPPVKTVYDYEGAPIALRRYFRHLSQRPPPSDFLRQARFVDNIRRFVIDDARNWSELSQLGWTDDERRIVLELARESLDRPEVDEWIRAGLHSDAFDTFRTAAQAADALGDDIWELRFERLCAGVHRLWPAVLETRDNERLTRAFVFAESAFDWNALSTRVEPVGDRRKRDDPTKEIGTILNRLASIHNQGWSILRASLTIPNEVFRFYALTAIASRPRDEWPHDIEALLQRRLNDDPDERIRELIETFLNGKRLPKYLGRP